MQLIPKWTKKGKLKEGGRDPLGLSAISERITSELVPGIITMTRIARNYTFYCWAIKIALKKKMNTLSEFKQNLAKLEAAWVIGGLLDDNETNRDGKGAIGKQRARRRINMSSNEDIDINFSVFKMKGGGFYQYYRSSIAQLGLILNTKYLPVLNPNGESLANIFESNINDTIYFNKYLNKDKIPKPVLLEYGQKSHFVYLKNTKIEREKLIEIFFNANDDTSDIPYSRRATLILLLDLVRIFEINNLILTDEDFRNIIFYKKTRKIEKYNIKTIKIVKILSFWRFFVFHDYLTASLEYILVCFIEATKRDSGTSIHEFFNENHNILDILSDYCGFDFSTKDILKIINQLLHICGIKKDFSPESSKLFDERVNIDSFLSEYTISKKISESFSKKEYSEVIAFSSLLLLIIIIRFRYYIDRFDDQTIWMRDLCDADHLNLFSIYNEVTININTLSFLEFFKFILDKIILQHDIVAREKQLSYGLNTFRFDRIGESFQFKQNLEYSQRNNKFRALISILEDLGLIIITDEQCLLTAKGKEVLEKYMM